VKDKISKILLLISYPHPPLKLHNGNSSKWQEAKRVSITSNPQRRLPDHETSHQQLLFNDLPCGVLHVSNSNSFFSPRHIEPPDMRVVRVFNVK
jgi:hypothetical protein